MPEPVRELRRQLGFDYGKFDFAISEQGPIVYDVNRTVGLAIDPRNPFRFEIAANLEKGIDRYLD